MISPNCSAFMFSQLDRRFKYFLDCLFTSVGINGLAILTWRSAWAIMDAYIYPGLLQLNSDCIHPQLVVSSLYVSNSLFDNGKLAFMETLPFFPM